MQRCLADEPGSPHSWSYTIKQSHVASTNDVDRHVFGGVRSLA